MRDAIAYVDPGEIGYLPLARAVIAHWRETGVKPTEERYGPEIVALARELWNEQRAAEKETAP